MEKLRREGIGPGDKNGKALKRGYGTRRLKWKSLEKRVWGLAIKICKS